MTTKTITGNDGWSSANKTATSLASRDEYAPTADGGQPSVDRPTQLGAADEEADDSLVESDEEESLPDESAQDSYRVNDNGVNNFKLKFDRINIEKLNKIDAGRPDEPANSKEFNGRAGEEPHNERDKNQLNANQLKRGLNEIIDESDEDVSRFSKRDVINKSNKSDKPGGAKPSWDSETNLSNQINQSDDERKASEFGAVIEKRVNDGRTVKAGGELNARANGAPDEPNKVHNGSNQVGNQVNNQVSNQTGNKASSPANKQVDQQRTNQLNDQIGNQIKSQFNPINGQTLSGQLKTIRPPENRMKSNPSAVKPLSAYFNSRLKARHVSSRDQLRILRREGQPLRLSCLPAFHAPSRSTVSWFKNGELIKVSVLLNQFDFTSSI